MSVVLERATCIAIIVHEGMITILQSVYGYLRTSISGHGHNINIRVDLVP